MLEKKHLSDEKIIGGECATPGVISLIAACEDEYIKKDLELRNICEVEFDDGHKMWTNFKRSNSDVDAGVGGFQILEGTGPYSKLKGIECLYAVSFLKDIIFTKSKCDISEKLFEQLKIK